MTIAENKTDKGKDCGAVSVRLWLRWEMSAVRFFRSGLLDGADSGKWSDFEQLDQSFLKLQKQYG